MNRRARVLLVDDDAMARQLYAGFLGSQAYDVACAADGASALAALRARPPEVMLVDLMMPGLDGYELCRQIKAEPGLGFIPVVIITALRAEDVPARAAEAGADDFLCKPVSGVELRTRVRSMLRIKQQYEALRSLVQRRQELVQMIMHDMCSPLQVIEGCSHLMLHQGRLHEEDRADAQAIHDQSARLRRFLDQILLTARMESGRLQPHCAPTSPREALMRVVPGWSRLAEMRGLRLQVNGDPDLVRPLDADLLVRIVDNLVGNAFSFSPAGGTIFLRWQAETSEPDSALVLEVEDQGPGLADQMRQRIFDPCESLESARGAVRYHGLGLAFCRLAAEAHGGAIVAEQGARGGALFRVRLPGGPAECPPADG